MCESEAWPPGQATLKAGGENHSQTTSALGHHGLEASVPACDSCNLVGELGHPLDRLGWVGRPQGEGRTVVLQAAQNQWLAL